MTWSHSSCNCSERSKLALTECLSWASVDMSPEGEGKGSGWGGRGGNEMKGRERNGEERTKERKESKGGGKGEKVKKRF